MASLLRFPNPGSDIPSFIQTFQILYEELGEQAVVTLDDMSAAWVKRNRVSSCGFMGDEALKRSTREDRSRDQLYNQSKMYSELYRMLGWFRSTPDARLKFSFTLLGVHVAVAKRNAKALFVQCLLGTVYPNPVLDVKGNFNSRPFACMLRTLGQMDGLLCRDELIVGPQSLQDDREPKAFDQMIKTLKGIRGDRERLRKAIATVGGTREIAEETMGNYTRFPIAALEWTGWTRKERVRIYGNSAVFLTLTDYGRKEIERLKQSADVRAVDIANEAPDVHSAFCRLAFYEMLARSDFDTSVVESEMTKDRATCEKLLKRLNVRSSDLLFSPFQELDEASLRRAFGMAITAEAKPAAAAAKLPAAPRAVEVVAPERAAGRIVLRYKGAAIPIDTKEPLVKNLAAALSAAKNNVRTAAELFARNFGTTNKGDFYPLVASLFRTIGLDCEASRPGINYQRWDAIIRDPAKSIPIEIKSPGEELFISVKGVRQAMENKIVLLARKQFATSTDTTSLVVGFNPPNDRSEVFDLVKDIKKAFGITIGVIDFRSLVMLSLASLQGNRPDITQIQTLFGIIDVANS